MIWKYFEWTKNEGTSNHYHLDILSSFLIFIMMIQANTCHLRTNTLNHATQHNTCNSTHTLQHMQVQAL